ncbi:ABC transporter permease, partial [candidate division KSB1 bacterium]
YTGNNIYRHNGISVRIHPDNISETVQFLREQWQKIIQDIPFDYFFINDNYIKSYQAEEKVTETIGIFSLIAIVLACLGLLGLAALTVTQRTKEIGIRKVLGASLYDIVALISKQFLILVLFSNIIAFPVAYFVMKDWLRNYPYRIELGFIFFIIGGLLALVIALLTVSFQAVKAARANPVESLRYE